MKNQSLIFNCFFVLFFASVMITSSSCKKEGCTNPFAENYDEDAKEDDGSCTLQRVKFLGTYNSVATCSGGGYDYVFTVTELATGENMVNFNNFFDGGNNFPGTVAGSSVTILVEEDGTTISGTGSIAGNTLTMTVSLTDSGSTDTCQITATKQ